MAKKEKFIVDPNTLSFVKIKKNRKDLLRSFFSWFSLTIVLFGLSLFISFYVIQTPKERRMAREIELARIKYAQLNGQLDLITEVVSDIESRDKNLYRMVFEAEPHIEKNLIYNENSEGNFDGNIVGSTLILNTAHKVDALTKKLYAQSRSLDEIFEMAKNKKERIKCMPAIMPINKKLGNVYSGFGTRLHPIFREYRPHTGIDLVAPRGTPIYATGDGVVKFAGSSTSGYSGYGIVVDIDHGFGYSSLYAHCSSVCVRTNQRVKRGDIIGYIGSTGYSTGSHLHYEVRIKNKPVNPVYYFFNELTPEEYGLILEKAAEVNQSLS